MSEFTFSDTMAEISLEVSEREIYNDIRTEVNITETETIIDQEEEYASNIFYEKNILLGSYWVLTPTLYSPIPVTKWIEAFATNVHGATSDISEAQCNAIGGRWDPNGVSGLAWCILSDNRYVRVTITSSSHSDKISLRISNLTPYELRCDVGVRYRYLVQPEESHTETWVRTVKIRRQDGSSISKYGRRVMNLIWPLGQSKEEMKATIEAYLERYKEPMPQITMKIQGTTEELIEQILTRKISDCVTIENTAMGMPTVDFFINSIVLIQDTGDLLEANWTLEQARDFELLSLFRLDSSLLDGEHVLAY